MNNITVLSHPMIDHKLSIIRNKETSTKDFWKNVYEVSLLLAYRVSETFPTQKVIVETPLCECEAQQLAKPVVLIPILRAGLGFIDGFREIIPEASVGFLGMYRDENTLEPMEYYAKFPNTLADSIVIICDPMLATGGSANLAIEALKSRGAQNIIFAALVGAPEGLKYIQEQHPDVRLYLAALDEKLDDRGFIVPGLGDCGDRLYGSNEG